MNSSVSLAALFVSTALVAAPAASPAESESGHYRDYSQKFPWIPAFGGPITAEEKAGFDRLRANPRYNPGPVQPASGGLTEARMDELERRVAETLRLEPDPVTGGVRGRPMVFTGEGGGKQADLAKPANFAADFYPLFADALKAYRESKGDAKHPVSDSLRSRARELLRRLAAHLAAQPWDPVAGNQPEVWMGNGYGWRDKDGGMGYRLLSAVHLLEQPAQRAGFLENMVWIQGSVGFKRWSSLSTDDYTNVCHQTLAAISLMSDSPGKRQRLAMMRHAVETSVLRPSSHGTVSADGGIIHHGFAHSSYASYQFGPLCRLLTDIANAGTKPTVDTPEVVSRLYAAARAKAWQSQPGMIVTSLEGRAGILSSGESPRATRPGGADLAALAVATADALGAPAGDPRRAEMAALLRVKEPGAKKPAVFDDATWNAAAQAPSPLRGHLAYPVAGASIHRRDDWMAVVRGIHRSRTGGEGVPYANPGSRHTFGELYSRGSLLLVADAAAPGAAPDLISSGHVADGYDMAMMPGATSLLRPWDKRIGGSYGTDAKLSATASLDGQGAWGFRPSWAAKSCFFFDNRITCITADAVMKPADGAPMVSCAIQFRHRDGETNADLLDGVAFGPENEKRLGDGAAHTLLTSTGHGYYFHPSPEPLVVSRRTQECRFMESGLLKPEFAKDNTWSSLMAKGVSNAERARSLDKFKPLTGSFTKVYWDHGVGAKQQAPVAFTLLVRSGAEGLEKFARSMRSPAEAPARISVSRAAHVIYDAPSAHWGAVFFDGGALGSEHDANCAFPVRAADRPCAIVLAHDPARAILRLAVSAGENPFFKNAHEMNPTAGVYKLTLAGRWATTPDARLKSEITPEGNTVVFVTMDDPRGRTLVLKSAP